MAILKQQNGKIGHFGRFCYFAIYICVWTWVPGIHKNDIGKGSLSKNLFLVGFHSLETDLITD